jgi:hypothetical protein
MIFTVTRTWVDKVEARVVDTTAKRLEKTLIARILFARQQNDLGKNPLPLWGKP